MAEFFEAFRDIETPEPVYPCSSCGRKFIGDTLIRHENICTKLKKRKPFDSVKQRTAGISDSVKTKVLHPTCTPSPKTKKNNWKQKHEDFLYTVRSARGLTSAIKNGGPLPPPPPQRIDPDLVQCPHCSRRFNEHSVKRHIEFCKEQKSRIGKSPKSASSVAAQRVAARTKYKPPQLAKRPPSGMTPSSAGKTRQTKTKFENTTPPQSSQLSRHDERPLQGTNKGNNTKTSNQSPTSRQDSKQTAVGRHKSATNSGEIRAINGQQSGKAYHSNRYKTKDNYMETVGSNYGTDVNKQKEIKYGRRASNTQECDGPADHVPEETLGYCLSSGQQDKGQGRGSMKGTRSNITVRDSSPTLSDDSSTFDQPSSASKKSPFPPGKALVHRPYVKDNHNNDTEDQKKLSKFCHECGTKYPVTSAKFCCECGTKRLYIS